MDQKAGFGTKVNMKQLYIAANTEIKSQKNHWDATQDKTEHDVTVVLLTTKT